MQSRAIWDSILMLAIVASVLPVNADASGGNPLSFGKPDFDLTGTVYDATTKQPIDGAYVVALYYKSIVGMAAMDLWCIKTKGMYTGKDGKFRFAVEKLDGNSPREVAAIKPGYYSGREVFPPADVWKKQTREAYTGRDTPLIPQDPEKPERWYGTGDVFCEHAKSREDAAAGIHFLQIRLSEEKRLKYFPAVVESTQFSIDFLEKLPASREGTK